jgi:predicted NUDIX family NTP pyrophosphohydrolase
MRKLSAGILMFRIDDGVLKVMIVHMGGPFWAGKDSRAWSIPKGEFNEGDRPREAAVREFEEELGAPPPDGELIELGELKQSSGKLITGYALRGDFNADAAVSNTFELEWPPGSGRTQSFPEIDRAAWVDCRTARTKLVKGQVPFLDRLITILTRDGDAISEGT